MRCSNNSSWHKGKKRTKVDVKGCAPERRGTLGIQNDRETTGPNIFWRVKRGRMKMLSPICDILSVWKSHDSHNNANAPLKHTELDLRNVPPSGHCLLPKVREPVALTREEKPWRGRGDCLA